MSNLAWDASDHDAVIAAIADTGGRAIDVAPTKIWSDLEFIEPARAQAFAAACKARGVRIIALQSLLFGKPKLQLFGEPAVRDATLAYLERVVELGTSMGATYFLFGAAANRRSLGQTPQACMDLAVPFFHHLADLATRRSSVICIEPLATHYGCDFICTTEEAVDLARRVEHPGFGIVLDTGTLALNGESIDAAVAVAGPYLRYVQLAEPGLQPIDTAHKANEARRLRELGYIGWISVEMLSREDGENVRRVAAAVAAISSAACRTTPM